MAELLKQFTILFTLPLNIIKLKKDGYKSKVSVWHLNLPTEETLVWFPVNIKYNSFIF